MSSDRPAPFAATGAPRAGPATVAATIEPDLADCKTALTGRRRRRDPRPAAPAAGSVFRNRARIPARPIDRAKSRPTVAGTRWKDARGRWTVSSPAAVRIRPLHPRNGKPVVRRGRKAMGPPAPPGGRQATERVSGATVASLPPVFFRREEAVCARRRRSARPIREPLPYSTPGPQRPSRRDRRAVSSCRRPCGWTSPSAPPPRRPAVRSPRPPVRSPYQRRVFP
jgi:hypothetical protein